MFIHGFPYTDYAEINLDWVIRKIVEQSKANGIEFDDIVTQIDANNVQTAIEKLKELIDTFTEGTLKTIVNGVNLDLWRDGYTFTHVQTVNNPTLLAIIEAVKNDNIIILKDSVSAGANNDFNYYYMIDIVEDTLNLVHKVSFLDFSTNKVHTIEIYAINDAENIYAVLIPDVTITYVNSFNGRTGAVASLPGDYDASDIDYDNTGSGLTATDTQSAIDELNTTKQNVLTFDATPTPGSNNPVTSDGIANAIPSVPVTSVFNRTGDVVATSGDYDASDIDYDNTVSGLSATDAQSAIDEVNAKFPNILKFIGAHNFTFTYDGVATCKDCVENLYAQLRTYIATKGSNYRFQIQRLRPSPGLPETYQLTKEFFTNTFAGNVSCCAVNCDWNAIESIAFSSSAKCTNIVMSTSVYTDFSTNVESNGSTAYLYINEYEIM